MKWYSHYRGLKTMAKRNPKLGAPGISLLLPQLEELGFVGVNARDAEEALDILDYTCSVLESVDDSPYPDSLFYRKDVKNEMPREVSFIPVESQEVLDMVGSYLLSNPFENHDSNYTTAKNARFLPDPSEPTTDLEELALQQAKVEGQQRERREKIISISDILSRGTVSGVRDVESYFSMLEQHMPDLALPGKDVIPEREAYTEKLFSEVVNVRGPEALDMYLIDLERIAVEGVTPVTEALVQSAPTLYRKLSRDDARFFVDSGIDAVRRYKNYTFQDKTERDEMLENVVAYFSLESDAAQQKMTYLIVKEHEALVPSYGQLKRELTEKETSLRDAHATVESLRKGLEVKIRENSDLEIEFAAVQAKYTKLRQNHYEDSALLEQEREKTARLEDQVRGKSVAYHTVAAERDDWAAKQKEVAQALTQKVVTLNSALSQLHGTKGNFSEYKTTATRKLGKSKVTAFVGWALAATLAVSTYVGFTRTHYSNTADPSEPVPALTTPPAPAPASGYDPQGRNLKQLEKNFYTFINQPRAAGEELTNLGPGCLNVLEQVYDKMQGTPAGKAYFLDSMAASDFCNKIPEEGFVKLGGQK